MQARAGVVSFLRERLAMRRRRACFRRFRVCDDLTRPLGLAWRCHTRRPPARLVGGFSRRRRRRRQVFSISSSSPPFHLCALQHHFFDYHYGVHRKGTLVSTHFTAAAPTSSGVGRTHDLPRAERIGVSRVAAATRSRPARGTARKLRFVSECIVLVPSSLP